MILNFCTHCFPNWTPLSARSSVFVCVLNLRLIFIICLCFAKRMHWCSTAWLEQADVRHSATFSRLCNVTLPLASRAKWLKLWLIEIGVGGLDWINLLNGTFIEIHWRLMHLEDCWGASQEADTALGLWTQKRNFYFQSKGFLCIELTSESALVSEVLFLVVPSTGRTANRASSYKAQQL